MLALLALTLIVSYALVFYWGMLYGVYRWQPKDCQRRHRDEL